ncbi:methyltransferase domain-containing protein [Flavobacteriales bacterium]|nr:methyltransferase domain-containing protein [Flavobacteriales bacterium]
MGMDIAKTLVSIATEENKSIKLLDVCCGVGTIMLEACASGFNIDGCDINPKRCEQTNKNLDFYGYSSTVYSSDIKNLNKKYDAAIIDLPYNMYSYSNDLATANIIKSTAKLANRVIIVSIADIKSSIKNAGLVIQDYCTAEKRGKSGFVRNIWVCMKY